MELSPSNPLPPSSDRPDEPASRRRAHVKSTSGRSLGIPPGANGARGQRRAELGPRRGLCVVGGGAGGGRRPRISRIVRARLLLWSWWWGCRDSRTHSAREISSRPPPPGSPKQQQSAAAPWGLMSALCAERRRRRRLARSARARPLRSAPFGLSLSLSENATQNRLGSTRAQV